LVFSSIVGLSGYHAAIECNKVQEDLPITSFVGGQDNDDVGDDDGDDDDDTPSFTDAAVFPAVFVFSALIRLRAWDSADTVSSQAGRSQSSTF